MKIFMSLLLACFVAMPTFAEDKPEEKSVSETILKEYQELREFVKKQEADYMVGHFMSAKQFDDALLLWDLEDDINDHEVLRLFRKRDNGKVFTVTYHRSATIIDGKIVIRRFVGTEPSGWVNHTIDYQTGEYLQSQGTAPFLQDEEKAMLENWGVTFFE